MFNFFRGANGKKTKAFREDYSKLSEIRSLVCTSKRIPFVSLTATALPSVEKAIIINLQMQCVQRVVEMPDQRNIRYAILKTEKDDPCKIFQWLIDDVREHGYETSRVIVFGQIHKHCRTLFREFDIRFKNDYPIYETRPYAMFMPRQMMMLKIIL